ncbi:NADH-quinone oxidoreductase subunit N [Halomonadaceae bacterium LMG 33818]|uniref:NADH-quinone oxidoreductase subunit NuoN n=1 Tax=Cernens ardua TaxID=3402176 RepID=UPI003EDC0E91
MNLTLTHLFAILPMVIVGITVVVVMLSVAWRRNHLLNATLSGIGLVLALLSVFWVWHSGSSLAASGMGFPTPVTPMLIVDGYSLFYSALILIGALACNIFAFSYLEGLKEHRDEFYLLLLCSTLGALVLASSIHMASLFVGLELMSVALYGMAAYTFQQRMSLEAGIKYMVLSAVASAFLLFGMALLFAAYGVLDFAGLGLRLVFSDSVNVWTLIGVGMIVIGLGFKLSIVPFHMWTSDVYEGAPAPVSAFLATVSKVSVFAVFVRFVMMVPTFSLKLSVIVGIIAVLSMLAGNLLALKQRNVKRLLAYSSIAHMGYLLSVIVALRSGVTNGNGHISMGGHLVMETTALYLVAYVLTSLGGFGVVSLCSSPYLGEEAGHINQLRGLYWRRPVLAVFMAFMLLSLAGIPLTAGFIGKFYVLALDMNDGLWWLVGAVIIGSAIGLYYYLRTMVALFQPESSDTIHAPVGGGQAVGAFTVGVAALLTLIVGIYPQPLIHLAQIALPVGF